jgi:hypothetical protein
MDTKINVLNDMFEALKRDNDAHKQSKLHCMEELLNYLDQTEKYILELESSHQALTNK